VNKVRGAAGSKSSAGEVITYYFIGKDMCKLNSDRLELDIYKARDASSLEY